LDRRPVEGNIDIPTSEVYDVVVFEGDRFIATRSGLGRIRQDGSTKLLTMEEGLPSNAVRSLALAAELHLLFVGTENGLAIVSLK
jgi:hypothetical protein